MRLNRLSIALALCAACALSGGRAHGQSPAAKGAAVISGELKQWHAVTLTLDGPAAREQDADPNPFTDYRMTVTFTHESGAPEYKVPGYFAADGDAANSSADSGSKWRAHLSPDAPGKWRYAVSFVKGRGVATDDAAAGEPVAPCDGLRGEFTIAPTDKQGRDLRAHGRLVYDGTRYLKFAGSGEYFLKAGADAPETLLGYADFDGTRSNKKPGSKPRPGEAAPGALHRYEPHLKDWAEGDPTWKGGKGKGLIGAVNYLAGKGVNAMSFLTYNAGGDGDNVWPFTERDQKTHYDCSKLDQWRIVFEHAQSKGLFLHFKTQETENDDLNGPGAKQSLDGGDVGPERKLYYRELIARFGHLLALNWNLGEENTQSTAQVTDMTRYFNGHDPYHHLVVIHTYPNKQDQVYAPLLGKGNWLTGASLQNEWDAAHQRTLKWVTESEKAGKPWVVANDEQGSAELGVPPDTGYMGFTPEKFKMNYDLNDVRKQTLWGTLTAGGMGVEYYFGYKLPQNDLACEDFRSRDKSWEYQAIALKFFKENKIPFWTMQNRDELVGNPKHGREKYCFAKEGEIYLVYLGYAKTATLDLSGAPPTARFEVKWFNPRTGGPLQDGRFPMVQDGSLASLGQPPSDPDQDWVALVRKIK